ncbi:hypothetical protein ACLB1G_26040 [Oxalobacteraceae bacterium A2-2]
MERLECALVLGVPLPRYTVEGLAQAMEWIAEGKSRNWKYEK